MILFSKTESNFLFTFTVEILSLSTVGTIAEKTSSFSVEGEKFILSISKPKYSKIYFEMLVLPLPGGPSIIRIIFEHSEIKIASVNL